MNGLQLEDVLTLIDSNIHSNMDSVRKEVVAYLSEHGDELAREIAEKGSGTIPTHIGSLRVSREDLAAVYA
jgi:hypothetical protein